MNDKKYFAYELLVLELQKVAFWYIWIKSEDPHFFVIYIYIYIFDIARVGPYLKAKRIKDNVMPRAMSAQTELYLPYQG